MFNDYKEPHTFTGHVKKKRGESSLNILLQIYFLLNKRHIFWGHLTLWSTIFRMSWKPASHRSSSWSSLSSWVQACSRHEASTQPLWVRRGRCRTGGSGDNSLCPGARRCVSVRATGRCEREPAAARWSDPESCCPGSPTTRRQSVLRCNCLSNLSHHVETSF